MANRRTDEGIAVMYVRGVLSFLVKAEVSRIKPSLLSVAARMIQHFSLSLTAAKRSVPLPRTITYSCSFKRPLFLQHLKLILNPKCEYLG